MPVKAPTQPDMGMFFSTEIPPQVRRTPFQRPVWKRRICRDGRPYAVVPWTLPGTLVVQKYGPMWKADRDYWVAKASLVIGRHDTSTHPNDGCPRGSQVSVNLWRVKHADSSVVTAILNSNSRLHVPADHHTDSVNDGEDGAFGAGDFAVQYLKENDQVYPEVFAVGSSTPGSQGVVSLTLVPIP